MTVYASETKAIGVGAGVFRSIELLVHATGAPAWSGSFSTTGGWYGEAGIGVARIFDIVRTDLTWRFSNPQRFFLGVAASTFF